MCVGGLTFDRTDHNHGQAKQTVDEGVRIQLRVVIDVARQLIRRVGHVIVGLVPQSLLL